MKYLIRRITALFLALSMTVSLLSVNVWAAEMTETDGNAVIAEEAAGETLNAAGGTCGESLEWSLSDTGTLTISGIGAMYNYGDYSNKAPWMTTPSAIKSVVVKSGVTVIGSRAFSKCTNLTSVSLPSTVNTLGNYAFYNCSALTSISLPDSILDMGLDIFRGCTRLKSVKLPNHISYIPYDAFLKCESLESITIPESVVDIGTNAFEHCESLTEVTIPDNVVVLGQSAFFSCENLRRVTIGSGMNGMGSDAFDEDQKLERVDVSPNNPYITSVDGVVYTKDMDVLIFHPVSNGTTLTVPDSVLSIRNAAFSEAAVISMQVQMLESVYFLGNAPTFNRSSFSCTKTTIYYPKDNPTWDSVVGQDYGGTLTWVPYDSGHKLRDLKDCDIRLEYDSTPWTGGPLYPDVSVTYHGTVVKYGVGFDVSYADNKEVGTATVTITGLGSYTGTVKKTFTITKAEQTLEVRLDRTTMEVGDKVQIIAFASVANTRSYTYTSSDPSVLEITTAGGYWYMNARAPGTAVLTVAVPEDDHYLAISKDITVTVIAYDEGLFDISNCTISQPANSSYSGFAYRPPVTVKRGSTSLRQNIDYTVTYDNNINAGTATMTIIGIGDYTGSVVRTFQIIKAGNNIVATADSSTIEIGQTTQITVDAVGAITFSSDDPDIASVTSTGLVTGLAVGTAYIEVAAAGDENHVGYSRYCIIKVVAPQVPEAIDLSGATIKIADSALVYNGQPKTPDVTVTLDGTTLTRGVDYTVTYHDNINATSNGATATAVGMGKYTGSVTGRFQIGQAQQGQLFRLITLSPVSICVGESFQVEAEGIGKMNYQSSDPWVASVDDQGVVTGLKTGYVKISVMASGSNNYAGAYADLSVNVNSSNITGCTMTLSASTFTYDGTAKKPAVTVKDGSKPLTQGTDYTVTYANNVNAGTATVTVTGKGNYSGAISKTFTITKAQQTVTAAVSTSTIQVGETAKITANGVGTILCISGNTNVASVSNDGIITGRSAGTAVITVKASGDSNTEAAETTVTITVVNPAAPEPIDISGCTMTLSFTSFTYDGTAKKPIVTVKDGSKTLTNGIDYTTTFANNVNVGTATVTVTGKGSYTGTISRTYTITKAQQIVTAALSASTIQVGETAAISSNGVGTITYTSDDAAVATVSAKGIVTGKSTGTAVITVKASGDSNTEAAETTVTITVVNPAAPEPVDISGCTMTLSFTSFTYDGTAKKPIVTVKDGSKTLTNGIDYTTTFANNVNVGTAIVTVTGKGSYTGTISRTYAITKAQQIVTAALSASTIQVGETAAITSNGVGTITYTSDNTAVATVSAKGIVIGKSTGTAVITVKASGDSNIAAAETTVTITVISPAAPEPINISGCTLTLSASSFTYDGTAKKPAVTVKDGAKMLVKDTDYTVAYANNTAVGTATVKVTGMGDYVGEVTLTFTIQCAAPTFTLSNITAGAQIKWTAVKGAAKYRIYRKIYGGTYAKLVDVTGTSYVDDTAKSGTKYVYTVRCLNADGTFAGPQPNGKSLLRLANPTLSGVTNTSTGVKVAWSRPTGAEGYYVYRKTGSEDYKKIKTITGAATLSYVDTTAANGTKYTYMVRAYKETFISSYAGKSVVRLTTPAISALSNVSGLKMKVTWGKNSKATGYQIQYSTTSDFSSGNKSVTVTGASTVTKTIGSLTKGKTYYVRVRSYKTVSDVKYYSGWSGKKSVKISK